MQNSIYILSAVSVKQNSKQDIYDMWEIHNLKYKRNDTFQQFLNWIAPLGRLRFSVDTYDAAYFVDKEKAMDYAVNNAADINEAGCYPYLVIYSRPIDTMYADAYDTSVQIFEFDSSDRKYHKICNTADTPLYKAIIQQFDIIHINHEALKNESEKYYMDLLGENASEKPLTMEQLKEMDGQPVWAELLRPTRGKNSGWALLYNDNGSAAPQRWTTWTLLYSEYGQTWIAYRCPPEKGILTCSTEKSPTSTGGEMNR